MNKAHGITKENLLASLPAVLANDDNMAALASAVAEVLAARVGEIERVSIYSQIDRLPNELLDILANAYWANAGGTVTADFSVLYNWNVCNMDWTPSAGRWFFDAGAGINVGGKGHYAYVGVAGSAKLGIAFKGAPVRLSFDWSPAFGPGIAYWDGGSHSEFNERALCNFGITCVYCF